ncbi:hypothetical protein BKA65DRAFT_490970 [Rhexocercosporidium sp. MPI-PUGE-AT-0058]|nr:hypothetical protein BKA65DRAFT_490970 [Rhexocercosporidium sp. MPI-PUGE-AT-0058]
MNTLKISWVIGLICSFAVGVCAQSGSIGPGSKESADNPIADVYPNGITGTFNSTIFVVPIPFKIARSIIPKQWGINRKAYCKLLPGFPADSYPLVIRSGVDHDIGVRAFNFRLDDFQLFHTMFPFVDLLGDGYSSFTYKKYLLLSATNTQGIAATIEYGTIPVPSTFSPDLEAYAYSAPGIGVRPGERYFNAYSALKPPGTPTAAVKFTSIGAVGPWPMEFYVNATNQPIFENGVLCDNQIFFYNTTLSTGENAPRGIKGSVTLNAPLLPNDSTFRNVFGIRVDTAFLEITKVPCDQLKGYHGTGPGDSGNGGSSRN